MFAEAVVGECGGTVFLLLALVLDIQIPRLHGHHQLLYRVCDSGEVTIQLCFQRVII
jgi:hypothetical protein